MLMDSKFEFGFDNWLSPARYLASLPVLTFRSLVPKSNLASCHRCGVTSLFFLNRLLNDVDRILEFIDIKEHSLDALKAIKRNFVDDFLVLLYLLLKKLTYKT